MQTTAFPPQDRPRVHSGPARIWRATRPWRRPLPLVLAIVGAAVVAIAWWRWREDPRAYVEHALDLMQTHSLRRAAIDWPAFRQAVREDARRAQSRAATHAALRRALRNLGDHHSFLQEAPATSWLDRFRAKPPLSMRVRWPRGEMMGDVAYVWIPGYSTGTPEDNRAFATEIQRIIARLAANRPVGWIVDLSDNTGGNMWPMLAGLGSLVGEGDVGAFVSPDGASGSWWCRAGAAGVGPNGFIAGNEVPASLTPPPRVAVLTGPKTASSGEAIVVAFRGRPDTRSFGAATRGLSTGNRSFRLSDGATMLLTTTIYADRTGRRYGDKIEPDETVEAAAMMPAALAWLHQR